jgi:monoamine oxidase
VIKTFASYPTPFWRRVDGYMEGAVRSGRATATEMLAALSGPWCFESLRRLIR